MAGGSVKNSSALQPQYPVIIEYIVIRILIITHAVDGITPGHSFVAGSNQVVVISAVKIFENVKSADVTVAHTQERKTHHIFAVCGFFQNHMLFTPGLALIPGDHSADPGIRMVIPAAADVFGIAEKNRPIFQADERTFTVTGIAFASG